MIGIERVTAVSFGEFERLVRMYFDSMRIPPELCDAAEELRRYIVPPCAAWLAFAPQACGTIALRPLPQRPGMCEVKRLFVAPDFRGRGIADALLDALEAFARDAGYRSAYLDSRADMHAAHRFYRRRGFEDCERYSDNFDATVFMRRSLMPAESSR